MPIRSINVQSSGIEGSDIASTAIAARHLDVTMRRGFIPIDVTRARVVSSTSGEGFSSVNLGYVSSGTTPALDVVSTALRQQRLVFSSAATAVVQFPPVPVPPDWSSNSSATLNFLANSLGSTDAGPSLNWTQYTSTGSSGAASTVTVSSAAKSTVPVAFSVNVAAAGYPNVLTFTVSVTSTQDQIALYSPWLEYTRNSTA